MFAVLLVLGLVAVALLALTVCWAALRGWRQQRQQLRRLTEQLVVNGRIEALTVQTLQAMRQAARERARE